MDRNSASLRKHVDLLASLFLLAAVALYGTFYVDFSGPPFEDAAMLMRYADNLAHGHGIVWNVGEAPVDGATDFLFMTTVAGLIRIGIPIGRAVRGLGVPAHVLMVLLVYWLNRRLWKAGLVVSLVTALYLAVGTGLWYVAAFFGTPVFALSVSVTWAIALILMRTKDPAWWLAWGFAFCALITGLIRPEGVILASFMLISIIVVRGWARSRQIMLAFALVMLVFGGAYFAWHWSYFGNPLPNPYYKKGAGLLHWDSLWESFRYLASFAGPFGLAFVLGLRSERTFRQTIAFLVPLVVFAASFVLVSNETNFGGRFQYALWPMVLMSYFPLVGDVLLGVGKRLRAALRQPGGWAWNVAGLIIVMVLCGYSASRACSLTAQQRACGIAYEADGRYDVAQLLAEYQDRNYVIATSEAGLLPLYSGWRAVDTWGLNDAWITRNGSVTAEYLDRYHPEVIAFHAYFSPLVPPRQNAKDAANAWHSMTLLLKSYAEEHDYILAAAFGDSPYEAHYYYVRRDFADSERLARQISSLRNYYWYATGKKALNYAKVEP